MHVTRWCATMVVAVGALGACDFGGDGPAADDVVDAEVGQGLSGIQVVGTCPVEDDLARIDLSMLILGNDPLHPRDERIEEGGIGLRLDPSHFTFRSVQPGAGDGVAAGSEGAQMDVSLLAERFEFAPAGGAGRVDDPKLVVMMLDHSGSMVGVDPFSGMFDPTRASDPDDQRIVFFSRLIEHLDEGVFMSLVSFGGDTPQITPEASVPTRNGAVIRDGLDALQFEEHGTTPMVRALDDTLSRIIEPNAGMNPVVILFTDGVEEGDPTDVDGAFEAMLARYRGDGARPSIPIIVLHLQPARSGPEGREGRDARLAELACRTGGEYIFLSHSDELTTRQPLLDAIAQRLHGAWRLTTSTTLSDPAFELGHWLLSTRLEATLDGRTAGVDLQADAPGDGIVDDARLWLEKR